MNCWAREKDDGGGGGNGWPRRRGLIPQESKRLAEGEEGARAEGARGQVRRCARGTAQGGRHHKRGEGDEGRSEDQDGRDRGERILLELGSYSWTKNAIAAFHHLAGERRLFRRRGSCSAAAVSDRVVGFCGGVAGGGGKAPVAARLHAADIRGTLPAGRLQGSRQPVPRAPRPPPAKEEVWFQRKAQ